jgi:hypothetical protein
MCCHIRKKPINNANAIPIAKLLSILHGFGGWVCDIYLSLMALRYLFSFGMQPSNYCLRTLRPNWFDDQMVIGKVKWSCFFGQVCGLAEMHLVYVHAAFRISACVEYAVSGVRSSRSMNSLNRTLLLLKRTAVLSRLAPSTSTAPMAGRKCLTRRLPVTVKRATISCGSWRRLRTRSGEFRNCGCRYPPVPGWSFPKARAMSGRRRPLQPLRSTTHCPILIATTD